MTQFKLLFAIILILVASDSVLHAQNPSVPIETDKTIHENEELLERAEEFLKSGKSLSVSQVREQMRRPRPEKFELAAVRTAPLKGRDLAVTARKAFIRFGWFGQEDDEPNGFSLGAAYALTSDGIFATCQHCVAPEGIQRGCLIALGTNGEMYPVISILAQDKVLDAAIVRIDVQGYEPLPLNANVAPGDAAYCLSDPLDAYGYFANGVINRFYRMTAPTRLLRPIPHDSPVLLRMNVSTDWAPGSSGAAVLDECGNAIGHASAIWSLSDEVGEFFDESEGASESGTPSIDAPRKPDQSSESETHSAVLITLHEAIPASSILELVRTTHAKAKP